MKSIFDKKGITPIVATIMLVGVSVAAFAFIYTYTTGMVGEQTEKFGEPIENWCLKVAYEASVSGDTIYVNNLASVPIYGFNLEISKDGSTTLTFVRSADGVIDPAESDSIISDTSLEGVGVKITPVLLGVGKTSGKGKIFTCDGAAKTLQ